MWDPGLVTIYSYCASKFDVENILLCQPAEFKHCNQKTNKTPSQSKPQTLVPFLIKIRVAWTLTYKRGVLNNYQGSNVGINFQ